MAVLPTTRTTASTRAEHVADHNEAHTGHNLDETHRNASAPHAGHVSLTADQEVTGVKTFDTFRPKRIPYTNLLSWPGTPNQQMTAAVADLLSTGRGEIVLEARSAPYDFTPFSLPPGITKLRGDDPEKTVIRSSSTTEGTLIRCYGSGQTIEGLTIDGRLDLLPPGTTGAVVQFAKPAGTTGGAASISGGLLLTAGVAAGATALPVTTATLAGAGYTVQPQPGDYIVLSTATQTEFARVATTYTPGNLSITLDAPLRFTWTTAASVSLRGTRCGVNGVIVKNGVFVGVDLWATIGAHATDSHFYDCLDTCLGISEGGARLTEIDRCWIDTDGLFGIALDSVDTTRYGRTGQIDIGKVRVRLRPRHARALVAERDGVLIMGASNVTGSSISVDLTAIPAAELAATGLRFTCAGSGYHFANLNVFGPAGAQINTYGARFGSATGTSVDAIINGGVMDSLYRGVELLSVSDAAVRNMVMKRITGYGVNITSHGTVVQRLAVEGNAFSDSFLGIAAEPAPAATSVLHKRGNLYRNMGFANEGINAGWTVNP